MSTQPIKPPSNKDLQVGEIRHTAKCAKDVHKSHAAALQDCRKENARLVADGFNFLTDDDLRTIVHEVYEGEKIANWRSECKDFGQLTTELPRFLADGLFPEACITAITGHSFNSKSWFALQSGWQISQGEPVFGYFNVPKRVKVIYHCPEMHEAQLRYYASVIGVKQCEEFLFRSMESGIWQLDDARMLASAKDRLVFLDTQSFFNPTDDGNSYNQAMKKFGGLCFNLLSQGAVGIGMVGHLAKPMQNKAGRIIEPPWTLENSIIGSAGYGALLRSLLRVKNLNPDLNDHKVHLYVQGMKNPGLKPFQLKGPAPLQMFAEPGKSPFLSQLLAGDDKYAEACVLFEKGDKTQREVA